MRILITGGTGSLGKYLVEELSKDNKITFTYYSNKQYALEIEKKYNAKAIHIDEIDNLNFTFDCVINNAGINLEPNLTENTSIETFKKILEVDVILPFQIIKKALPYMKKNNRGRIINISSVYAIKPEVELVAFNSAKSALEGLTKTVAKEYAEYGITSNGILPSAFESKVMNDIMNVYAKTGDEKRKYLEMLTNEIPMKRLGNPKEIAKLVRFLISDDACFITGASIPIDGGFLL